MPPNIDRSLPSGSLSRRRRSGAWPPILAWNALEENKYYLFDYYRDNCATRVRNLIDNATDGALHAATHTPASFTWREHTERLAADDPFVFFGLDLAMGGFIDQPITFWEEMFLPAKLEEGLRRTVVPVEDASGTHGANGSWSRPRQFWWLPVACRRERRRRIGRRSFSRLGARPPFFSCSSDGAPGEAVARSSSPSASPSRCSAACSAFSDACSRSCGRSPTTKSLIATRTSCSAFPSLFSWHGRAFAWRSGEAAPPREPTGLRASGSVAPPPGLALKVLPWFGQHNEHLIAFFLPLWAGIALSTRLVTGPRR